MEKIDILYDHYKESNQLSKDAQESRNKFFKYLCLAMLFNLLFLIYPNESISIIDQILNNKYNTVTPIAFIIVQAFLWALITHLLMQYLHKNIYVERQYSYLNILEKEIGSHLNSGLFNREGDNYLKNYPLISNVLDIFYKCFFPILVVGINGTKLVFEYINGVCLFLKIFDTICFLFILLLIILYLKMLYFDTHSKKETKKIKININIIKNTTN